MAHNRDNLKGRKVLRDARIVCLDCIVIPLRNHAGEDLGERLATEAQHRDLLATNVEVVHEGSATSDDRHVGERAGGGRVSDTRALVCDAVRDLSHGKVDVTVLELLAAIRGASAGEVDSKAVLIDVASPLVDRILRPRGARSGNRNVRVSACWSRNRN